MHLFPVQGSVTFGALAALLQIGLPGPCGLQSDGQKGQVAAGGARPACLGSASGVSTGQGVAIPQHPGPVDDTLSRVPLLCN